MNEVNSGNTFQDQYVYLLENIDLENQEWDVIGSYTDNTTNNAFSGIFEGNNRTINGLNINKNQEHLGLFAYNTGIIRDIILESGNITGVTKIGGIVSVSVGTIENCHNNGVDITATGKIGETNVLIGGIVYSSQKDISYCSNNADLKSENGGYVAGIATLIGNRSKISNCYNIGDIHGGYNVGGISAQGNENTTIEQCYNTGNITGVSKNSSATFCGGIAGTISRKNY